jgi:hypothetical protein
MKKNGSGDKEAVATRGDVYLVQLDPTRGSEIRKTRPCLVVSPDELKNHKGEHHDHSERS